MSGYEMFGPAYSILPSYPSGGWWVLRWPLHYLGVGLGTTSVTADVLLMT